MSMRAGDEPRRYVVLKLIDRDPVTGAEKEVDFLYSWNFESATAVFDELRDILHRRCGVTV